MISRTMKKTVKLNETEKFHPLFNVMVFSIYILFVKIQLNTFQKYFH